MNERTDKKIFNSEELIYQLYALCSDDKFKRPNPLPEFTLKEALFIRDLIFQKPKDIVYFYFFDHISERSEVGKCGLFNSKGYRRYLFSKHFLECRGNAAEAARRAGYSPRSAKQQGHRLLRQIQWFSQREQDTS
jgi:hypothetical protein